MPPAPGPSRPSVLGVARRSLGALPLRAPALFFAVPALLAGYLALAGGGYDVVVRQQLFLAIWASIAVGVGTGVLSRRRPPRGCLLPLGALAGLTLWMALSLVWTESTERTTAELARVAGYGGLVALVLIAVGRPRFRHVATGLSAAALAIAVIAIASRLFPGLLPQSAVEAAFHTGKLSYPFDYWDAVGVWGSMGVAIGLAWSAHAGAAATRALSLGLVPVAALAVYLAGAPVATLAIVVAVGAVLALSRHRLTAVAHLAAAAVATLAAAAVAGHYPQIAHSTGGAGGPAVALVLVLGGLGCAAATVLTADGALDRLRLPRTAVRLVGPPLALVVLTLAIALGHGPVSNAWNQLSSQPAFDAGFDPAARPAVGAERRQLWGSALDEFARQPLGGSGAGTFEFSWNRDGKDAALVRDAHSLYLEALGELGIPGLLLLLAFLGGLLTLALRARSLLDDDDDVAAAAAMTSAFLIFVVVAAVDWLWEETAIAVFALAAVSVVAASARSRRAEDERLGWHPRARAAAALAAAAICAVQAPGLIAVERVRASDAALRRGQPEHALALAGEAIDSEPWAATPYVARALVRERQHRYVEAAADVRRAIAREPANWRHPLLLARIDIESGDRDAARRDFRRGERLAPRLPLFAPSSPIGSRVFAAPGAPPLPAPPASAGGRLAVTLGFEDETQALQGLPPPRGLAFTAPLPWLILAGALALLAGFVVVRVRNALDSSVSDPERLRRELELPLLAGLGVETLENFGSGRPGPARLTQPDFETFRELQARLDAVVPFRVPRSLVVTSALPAEGKSAAAAGIAIAAAAAGRRTLLVECDLHRPVLASRLGLAGRPGLTDYLAGQAGPKEVVQPVRLVPPAALSTGLPSVGLFCLVAGGGSARPAELLGSQRFRAFLDQVCRAYDLVVCDGPPILDHAGADQLLEAVEAALLCVRLGQTTHEQAAIAKAEIDRAGVEIAGLLVTGGRL